MLIDVYVVNIKAVLARVERQTDSSFGMVDSTGTLTTPSDSMCIPFFMDIKKEKDHGNEITSIKHERTNLGIVPGINESAQCMSESKQIQQLSITPQAESDAVELNDVNRDLYFPKQSAELLASRLQEKRRLKPGTSVSFYRNSEAELRKYFHSDGQLIYCNDVEGLHLAMGMPAYYSSISFFMYIKKEKDEDHENEITSIEHERTNLGIVPGINESVQCMSESQQSQQWIVTPKAVSDAPSYLSDLISVRNTVNKTRTSYETRLNVADYAQKLYGARAFSVAAPRFGKQLFFTMSNLITSDTSIIRHRNLNKMVPAINELNPSVNGLQKEETVCNVEHSSDEINFSKFHDDEELLKEINKITSKRSSLSSEEYESDDAAMLVQTIHPSQEKVDETAISIAVQIFVPFLIAGLGTVGAGLVLDVVQHWKVFTDVSEVFILVPALLGLKGNLEMTLASRLSTQANLGNMDTRSNQWKMIYGNLALIQCQAAVVGFLASLAAMIMGWIPDGKFDWNHALLLCAASLVTASLASFVLGIIMVLVVIASRKCNVNPDNVATPIAASLGDLTTLSVLAAVSSVLFDSIGNNPWLAPFLIAVFLSLTPVWIYISKTNKYVEPVLYSGWTPVISAMAISSIGGLFKSNLAVSKMNCVIKLYLSCSVGGLILDFTVSSFHGIAVFQPVINGVGGNLVAVQASRISTYLHQRTRLGVLPSSDSKICLNPCSAFCGSDQHSKTARVLLSLVIPGHLVFTYAIFYLQAGHTSITPIFAVVYLSATMIQVILLLYCAHCMVFSMWKRSIDPDNSAIPYLTAIGDLLGTGLLSVAFLFLYQIGDRDSDVGD
ncbi:Solute carrier family 41 member 2 [Nymphon striatum]|nr:Solute carrier family 41 member 2 [Nymphon striatum]